MFHEPNDDRLVSHEAHLIVITSNVYSLKQRKCTKSLLHSFLVADKKEIGLNAD